MATIRTGPVALPDIVTFRLGGKLVYVKPTDNYEDALDVAQKEFPEFLKSIPRDRIGFYMHADVGKQRHRVRISESAWASTIARMQRAEIVDVSTRPDENSEKDSPPDYLALHENQPAITLSLPAHSNPSSRAPSPTPSTGNKNPRSWFGSTSR